MSLRYPPRKLRVLPSLHFVAFGGVGAVVLDRRVDRAALAPERHGGAPHIDKGVKLNVRLAPCLRQLVALTSVGRRGTVLLFGGSGRSGDRR
jgi:hypothetical protein